MDKFKLRFIPLGGTTDVTKNMYLYELYQDDRLKDILIVDCGIGFPRQGQLGVDFVIPDISYLEDKTSFIRAVLLTHGHEDHTSALPYHFDELGRPPVFGSKLTAAFVENKFEELGKRIKVNRIDYQREYVFGQFRVKFLRVTHSIPDSTHILIKTPLGTIYHGADFKFDLTPPFGKPPDFYEIVKAGREGVLCLLSDCLGAERPGLTLSEAAVGKTFEEEIRTTRGKFIMTTFSSNISRIRQCVEAAIKFNRKIAFLGRSMKENTRLASEIGYLPIPKTLIVDEEDVGRLPPSKVCLIVAGSQGQYSSALAKLANDQNPNIKIRPGDKIIFSSDPIPGNENEVYGVIEDLISQGADVYYSDIAEQLHSSGHGNQEDLKFLIRFTNPKFFIPIGGTLRHQRQYQKLVQQLGYQKEKVFGLTEGETIWFRMTGKGVDVYKGAKIETKNIYVDAYGIGDVGNIVLRDRKTLSTEGIVFAFLVVNQEGMLVTRPKILSRGFVFEKEEKRLYEQAIRLIERMTKPKGGRVDIGNLKRGIIGQLEDFFYQKRGRKPLVVVEVVEV